MARSDEFSRIAEIRRRLQCKRTGVEVGLGDDAAVLANAGGSQVLSVDTVVEGVHFRREWAGFEDIGFRAAMAALSDLAAMGAEARAALLAFTLPPSLDDAALYAMVDGAQQACVECGCSVVGGNLAGGSELSITTTAVGQIHGRPLQRAGAKSGDWICLTGPVGAAALGMHALAAHAQGADAARFAQAWRRPRARIHAGQALRTMAHAGIDISDGLLQDLGHVCDASGVGAHVETERIPLREGHVELADRLGLDPLHLALNGGDDYELIVACPDPEPLSQWATPIGHITGDASVIQAVDRNGRGLHVEPHGYRHWSG